MRLGLAVLALIGAAMLFYFPYRHAADSDPPVATRASSATGSFLVASSSATSTKPGTRLAVVQEPPGASARWANVSEDLETDARWEQSFPDLTGEFSFAAKRDRDRHERDVLDRLRVPLEQSRFWRGEVRFVFGATTGEATFFAVFSDLDNRRSEQPLRTIMGADRLSWNLLALFAANGRVDKGNLASTLAAVPRKGEELYLVLKCDVYESLRKWCRYWALPLPGRRAAAQWLPPGEVRGWRSLPFAWKAVGEREYRAFTDRWAKAE